LESLFVWFQAVVLGIIQGLTEFLPISSSASLRIYPALFGWEDPGASFTAITQLGTVAAVLTFFWREIWSITKWTAKSTVSREARQNPDARLGWSIALGTLPIIVIGLTFDDVIVSAFRNLSLICSVLAIFGVLLYVVDIKAKQSHVLTVPTWRQSIYLGFAQSLALIPGVSRSGITITAARGLGFSRESAARFSFLLSVPAVVLSGVYGFRDISATGVTSWGPTIIATLAAFVSGYLAIGWLLKYLVTHDTKVFLIYRVGLAAIMFVLLGAGVIPAT
jgi:undecaprenyl-diphosphatase